MNVPVSTAPASGVEASQEAAGLAAAPVQPRPAAAARAQAARRLREEVLQLILQVQMFLPCLAISGRASLAGPLALQHVQMRTIGASLVHGQQQVLMLRQSAQLYCGRVAAVGDTGDDTVGGGWSGSVVHGRDGRRRSNLGRRS